MTTLQAFIDAKRFELHEKYRVVELLSHRSVTLRDNSVGEKFTAVDTSLMQIGQEVKPSEFPNLPPFSDENGTEVIFNVTAKGKWKPERINFYFLWTTEK